MEEGGDEGLLVAVLQQRVEAVHGGGEEEGASQAKMTRSVRDTLCDGRLHLRGGDGLLRHDGGGDGAGGAEGLQQPVVHALVPVEKKEWTVREEAHIAAHHLDFEGFPAR